MKSFFAVILFFFSTTAFAQSWQSIASMQYARAESEAVELHDGTILVVGGYGNGSVLSSCEIYDPNTNTWRSTGSLIVGRFRFSLNILPSGKVVAMGGLTDLDIATTADCEVYDPATGEWSELQQLPQPVENFPTAYLDDSTVVYLGGLDANYPASYLGVSGEINPTTLQNASIAPMQIGTYSDFGQYLSNRHIIVKGGGCIGGIGGFYLLSTEIYSLDTKKWVLGDSLVLPLTDGNQHMVQMPDESLVEPSGRVGDNTTTLNVSAFDPISMRWGIRGQLQKPHFHCFSVLVGQDSILTIGGATDPEYTQNIIAYTDWYSYQDSSSWVGPPLIQPLHVYSCVNNKVPVDDCSHSEAIYVFGGETTGKVQVNTCEKLIIGNKPNPPIISLSPSAISTLNLACNMSDTTITISLGNCTSVTLDSINALDSSFQILGTNGFPITIQPNGSIQIKLLLQWLSSASSSSAIKLSFQSPVGPQIKYIHISGIDTIAAKAYSLSVPSQPAQILRSSCGSADTFVPLGVEGCGMATGTLDSAWLTGSPAFSITDTRAAPRAIAASDSVALSYTGTSGPDTAYLHLRYNLGSGTLDTVVTVIGTLASPLLAEPQQLHREAASAYYGAIDTLMMGVDISSNINIDSLWPYLTDIEGTFTWDPSVVSYAGYLQPTGWTLTSLATHSDAVDFGIHNTSSQPQNPMDLGSALFAPASTELATTWVTLSNLSMTASGQTITLCVTDNEDNHWAVKTLGELAGVGNSGTGGTPALQEFVLYPNPAGDELFIQNAGVGTASVGIYDVIGRLVARSTVDAGTTSTIDVHSLESGVYVVRISHGGITDSRVIVKQ